ncbi:MAG: hypothetical protein R3B93_21105 [Bacteroidia bacterium]
MKSILITIPGQRNLEYHYQGQWLDPWKYKNLLPEAEAKVFGYRSWTPASVGKFYRKQQIFV